MDPLLLIIRYLFKKNGIDNNDASIDAFFENGISFPQLISIIFKIDEIPKINQNPKTIFHKKMNNDVALQYLFQKNNTIAKFNPNFGNERDNTNLLLLIFTKQCFDLNINEIILTCNMIVRSLNIKYEKKSDIMHGNCLLSLLNVLTDGKVQLVKDVDSANNFDEIMLQNFQQANAPLVINKTSLEIRNQNIFLIQIEILFEVFSDKIKQLSQQPQEQTNDELSQNQNKQVQGKIPDQKEQVQKEADIKESIQKNTGQNEQIQKVADAQESVQKNTVQKEQVQRESEQEVKDLVNGETIEKIEYDDEEEEKEEEDVPDEVIGQEQYGVDDWAKVDKKIKKKKKKKIFTKLKKKDSDSSSSDNDDIEKEEIQEEALLKTLNVIGRGKFHFNNFHDAVINDSIPRFVMFFFNLDSIKDVHLQPIKSPQKDQKDQKITKDEIKNINAVIEFLKSKEIRFRLLKFNFGDSDTEESSAVLFYSNFLNYFFINTTKKELYDRVGAILVTHMTLDDEDFYELTHIDTLAALVHFYFKKSLHFKLRELPDTFEELVQFCEKAKIPLIVNQSILDIGYGSSMADSVYYQYQIILDAIDSGPECLRVFELLLKAIYFLEKIKIPEYDQIAGSIRAKRTSLEFQNQRSEQYLKRTSSKSISSMSSEMSIQIEPIKEEVTVKTYKVRHQESIDKTLNEDTQKDYQTTNIDDAKDSAEQFWTSSDISFGFDEGIMYNKIKQRVDLPNIQKKWSNEIAKIQQNIKKTEQKKTKNEEFQKIQQMVTFKNSQNSFTSELYKIFLYNEADESWSFQSDVFEKFILDKHVNIENSKTPLVLILNSYREVTISLTTNFMSGLYPKLDSEEQIFVYGFCDKPLSMLNYILDFSNKNKTAIKPMFLLLHVPKSKESLPNLHQIIFEIYSFLSFISNLNIVVLDKKYCLNQVVVMSGLKDMSDSLQSKLDQIEDADVDLFSSDDDSTSASQKDDEEEDQNEEEDIEKGWENINITNEFKNEFKKEKEGNLPEICLMNGKTIFLVNEPTAQYSKEFAKQLEENEFFIDLKNLIDGENAIHYINVKEPETYESFLKSFNDILMENISTISQIKTNFAAVSLVKYSSAYTNIRSYGSSWKNRLKELVSLRKTDLEKNSTDNENSFVFISQIRNELSQITPPFDIQFEEECTSVIAELRSLGSKKNREILEAELKISAESHLEYVKDQINQEFYWTEEQMDLIKKSHSIFLKNEFFDIIQMTSTEKIYNMIYEENFDIFEKQVEKGKAVIDEYFKPFVEKIKIKENPQEQDIEKQIQKGANYSMKETENLREIKVTVQIKKDLKSEIEQDF